MGNDWTQEVVNTTPFRPKRYTEDTAPMIVIRAKPGAPEAYYSLTVATTNITFKKGADAGSAAVDANVGAAGVIDLTAAAYNTYGELSNYLNSLDDYEAYLDGARPEDNTYATAVRIMAQAEIAIKNAAGVALLSDTSADLFMSLAVRNQSFVFSSEDGVVNQLSDALLNLGGTGARSYAIYEVKGITENSAGSSTLRASITSATATGTADKLSALISMLQPLGFEDAKLIIRAIWATTETTGSVEIYYRTLKFQPKRFT